MMKRQFSVTIHFSLDEYNIFRQWYINQCKYGANSFLFPCIDSNSGEDKEYRFALGGNPRYTNPSGVIIECSMTWEEV